MTLLQYYLLANIYILVFWIGYRICLRNMVYFRSVRIYLNAVVVLSAILPLIQTGIAELIGSTSLVTAGLDLPIVGAIYQYQLGETLSTTTTRSVDWSLIFKTILLSGSVATALIHMYNHFRIQSLIGRSSEYLKLENGLKALKSDKVGIPFIYINRIIIPSNISDEEISQVITHEIMHHRNAHYLDNMLFSLLHMVFWANPFFLLLRSALKLNHEFQVDDQILSTGADPVSYKLSLVKYSVGSKLFSLANGLSSIKTKNRLMMINNKPIKKGKWRLFLIVPTLAVLFAAFTFAYIQPVPYSVQSEAPAIIRQDDTLRVKIVDIMEGTEGRDVVVYKNSVIQVLMNRSSEIMVAEEVLSLEKLEQKIISVYNSKIEDPKVTTEIKIHVFKDIIADNNKYTQLLDVISSAIFKLREMHSIRLYGGLYDSLTANEKETIDSLIPLRIYGKVPAEYVELDTPPLFQGKDNDEFLYYIA